MKNKNKVTTIKDLAKIVGVSIATISNALNNSRYVKKETKDKINKIARELNYSPNIIGRTLKVRSTNTLVLNCVN